MSNKKFIAAACATATLLPAIAQGGQAQGGQYIVDPMHTYPSLEMPHMGISIWRGKFNKTRGTIVLDTHAKTGQAEIAVDTDSIDFGLDQMHEYAAKEDWLSIAKFPTMTYKGKIEFDGEAPAAVDGELTLRGVTKPLKLKINSFNCIPHPMLKREVCGADAEGDVNRVDFGMDKYSGMGMDMIHIKIQVEAIKND